MTAYETEMLTILAEECAELQKNICKALRHGLDSSNPKETDSNTNRQEIEHEAGDVLALIYILEGASILSATNVAFWKSSKPNRMQPYLHSVAQATRTVKESK